MVMYGLYRVFVAISGAPVPGTMYDRMIMSSLALRSARCSAFLLLLLAYRSRCAGYILPAMDGWIILTVLSTFQVPAGGLLSFPRISLSRASMRTDWATAG